MLKKLRASFQGRAASYWLNAQADAKIAQEIIGYLRNSTTTTLENHRFVQILELSHQSPEPHFFLACCAYTLWEINGRMDYEVANIYTRLSQFDNCLPAKHFSQPSPSPLPLLSCWLLPVARNQQGLQRFLKQHNLTCTGSSEVFIKAIIAIQEINIAHNLETIAAASTTTSNKAKQLQQLSNYSSDPELFMASAKQTQHAAIFWDKLFIRLLKP